MESQTFLNNRYQISGKVGAGGMAQVFQAQDLFLKRNVALKIINMDSKIDNLNQERFLQEIKAVSRVRHPNVISVYDIFIDQKNWCLVLELVNGKTLKQYLQQNGVLGVSETLKIFEKILMGVAACHKAGIIHRDLKPDNILLANNGAIKVLDFGIAIIDNYEVKKHPHQIIGTMKYIDPEVVKLKPPQVTSDIYAIGIMLYEMLLGKPPFFHKNPQLLANKHVKEPMPLIRNFNPAIPQSIENIILKATSKDTKQRYQTAEAMLAALNSALEQHQKHVKRVIQKDKFFRTKRKIFKITDALNYQPFFVKRWFSWLLLSLLLCLVVCMVIILIFYLIRG